MDDQLATAQTLRYAEEFRDLYEQERTQRERAERALEQLRASYATTVRALASTLELRDDISGNHAERVTALARRLTERVAPGLLDDPELEFGFLLHDLGKIGIPDAVLHKPGPLTDHEWNTMREHPVLGEAIISQIPFLRGVARDVVASHHERWDGAGYPQGLKGADIPLPARIFAVADSWDAMTNARPYRAALAAEHALTEITNVAGAQLDPGVVEAFIGLLQDGRQAT